MRCALTQTNNAFAFFRFNYENNADQIKLVQCKLLLSSLFFFSLVDPMKFRFRLTFAYIEFKENHKYWIVLVVRCANDLTVRNSSKSLGLLEFSEENDTEKNAYLVQSSHDFTLVNVISMLIFWICRCQLPSNPYFVFCL